MPVIVVNTAADTIAADGKTSLREAVQQAAGMTGKVDIVFDMPTFYNTSTYSLTEIVLTQTLVIAKGNITIDGSLYYGGTANGLKISGAGLSTNAITVEANATVTLRDLTVHGSSSATIKGNYGTDGTNGTDGLHGSPDFHDLPGIHGSPGNGVSGGHATDGTDAPNNAESGRIAVGGVINRGNLTLERVDIQSFKTEGGDGGLGGAGGWAGGGGNGQNGATTSNGPTTGVPGDGGNGGNAGDGARGGDGGDAVGGIYNVGALTLRDVSFTGLTATGGDGGHGGLGHNGGRGGNSGESFFWDTLRVAVAGNGGNGGDGGNGGRGGAAAAALLNLGTVTWNGVQSGVNGYQVNAGFGGQHGEGGIAGYGGTAFEAFTADDPRNGHDGLIAGVNGQNGAAGGSGQFLGASVATSATFIVDAPRIVISEQDDLLGRVVSFTGRLLGGSQTGLKTVDWKITGGKGFTVADFEAIGGVTPVLAGKYEFNNSANSTGFGFRIAQDGKAEGIESFTLTLSNPNGGVLGWSKSVTVYITDGDADGKAPTAIKLSDTSLKENSKTNFTLGSLTTTDGDKGDQFTYELLNNAGGRYKLSGNTIKVANGTLLDYEQARSHTITVRSTDLFGNSIDKKITIALENVDPENLKGDGAANKLFGGAGKDTINGGLGNDTLQGGAAADRFVFDTKLNASTNVDHITDFKPGTDKIVLDNAIFTKLTGTTLATGAFHTALTAHDPSDRILYHKSSGKLLYDADGDKTGSSPVLFAIIDTHVTLTAADFVIV